MYSVRRTRRRLCHSAEMGRSSRVQVLLDRTCLKPGTGALLLVPLQEIERRKSNSESNSKFNSKEMERRKINS